MTAVVGAPPKFLCSAACPLAGANLSAPRGGCVAYSSLCTALHRHFGFSSFKAGKLEALFPALHILCCEIQWLFLISVFMSPETAVDQSCRSMFESPYFQQHLVLVAIDEAHLIHEW